MKIKSAKKILILSFIKTMYRERKIEMMKCFILMLLSSFGETITLLSVIPLLKSLTQPEILYEDNNFKFLSNFFSFKDPSDVFLPIVFIFIISITLSSYLKLITIKANSFFGASVGSDLSLMVFKKSLCQSYTFHLERNSADTISTVTSLVDRAQKYVTSFLNFLTFALIAVSLVISLLILNTSIAITSFIVFGVSYLLIIQFVNKRIYKNGKVVAESIQKLLKILQEGYGGIRDVILNRSENFYLEEFSILNRPMRLKEAQNNVLIGFPKILIEAIGLIFIALTGLILYLTNNSNSFIVTSLGIFALASQRILPAIQSSYASWAGMRSEEASAREVLNLINTPIGEQFKIKPSNKILFKNQISFEKVNFKYAKSSKIILKNIDFVIKKGERIGIVGPTGSGKSTLADLMIGLLKPTSGKILIDGVDIFDQNQPQNISKWQMNIANVPQTIFLSDISIAENIAFGIKKEEIDLGKVRNVARKSKIHEFIDSMPEKYNSRVGDRGLKLSGGQKQRIIIARALYKNADVLVFDEATSALDINTEKLISDTILSLNRSITLVIIAHRLSTVEQCDKVIRIEHGEIKAVGKPKKILFDD